jgi:hypothetical protein
MRGLIAGGTAYGARAFDGPATARIATTPMISKSGFCDQKTLIRSCVSWMSLLEYSLIEVSLWNVCVTFTRCLAALATRSVLLDRWDWDRARGWSQNPNQLALFCVC